MGMLFRMLAPRPLKKARRALHPVSLMTPRPVRKAKMAVVDATHPVGAIKRSAKRAVVQGVRTTRPSASTSPDAPSEPHYVSDETFDAKLAEMHREGAIDALWAELKADQPYLTDAHRAEWERYSADYARWTCGLRAEEPIMSFRQLRQPGAYSPTDDAIGDGIGTLEQQRTRANGTTIAEREANGTMSEQERRLRAYQATGTYSLPTDQP
jgi:hypothetical protein